MAPLLDGPGTSNEPPSTSGTPLPPITGVPSDSHPKSTSHTNQAHCEDGTSSGSLPRLDAASARSDAELEIITPTPIHKACYDGDLAGIKALLASSPGLLEHRDPFFMTPFMTACLCGDIDMVRYFVEKGADTHALDNERRTGFHYAVLNNNPHIIGYLTKDMKLDVNAMDASQRTPVYIAAANGRVDAVKELLSYGADPTIADEQGRTPVMVACERTTGQNAKDSIKVLLQEPQMRLIHNNGQRRKSSGARRASCSGDTEDEDNIDGLGVTVEDFIKASSILEKLRMEVWQLTEFRTTIIKQLTEGHLRSFVSEDDEQLMKILEAFAANITPWEDPLFKALDKILEAHVCFERAQNLVRHLVKSVPESQVEDNTMLVANSELNSAVQSRDEKRDELFTSLVSFLDLTKSRDRLEESIGDNSKVAQEILEIIKRGEPDDPTPEMLQETKSYNETVSQCHACLNQASMWEKEVTRNMESEGMRTNSAKAALATALASSLDFTSGTHSMSLQFAIKSLAIQACKEKKMLRRLRNGQEIEPPFPHFEMYDIARYVRVELEKRVVHLRDIQARVDHWSKYRSVLEPWVRRGAVAIAGDFLAENWQQKEKLLQVENEILDKMYEKAKIQNARMRKGQSQARSSEAEANKQAILELQIEKWAASKQRKAFLLQWRRYKLDYVPELPLALSDILGPFWEQMGVTLQDPIVELFSPGMTFADYQLQNVVSGVRREVHKAMYDGEIYALKVFPNLIENNMRSFMRDVSIRYKLQTTGLPIVPVEAAFTDTDHNGTGYMVMKYYNLDLLAWATTQARTVREVTAVIHKVLLAVSSIHSLGITHGDIKADNILMDGDLPRLADFEQSYADSPPFTASIMFAKLTLDYMAPELKTGEGGATATQTSDMYSCGVLIKKVLEVTSLIHEPSKLQGLMTRLCVDRPQDRLTAGQALNDDAFEDLRHPAAVTPVGVDQ